MGPTALRDLWTTEQLKYLAQGHKKRRRKAPCAVACKILDSNELQNYRHVSNIAYISKLIEKVVTKQITDHMSLKTLESGFSQLILPT